MIQFAIFVGGVFVGFATCKLYDYLTDNKDKWKIVHENWDNNTRRHETTSSPMVIHNGESTFNLSLLRSVMSEFGVDITNRDCLYLLIRRIEKVEYERMLSKIQDETSSAEQLILLLQNLSVFEFKIPIMSPSASGPFIKLSRIDQLLEQNNISKINLSTTELKVEVLINSAYAKALETLKNEFGDLFTKLIEAHEGNKDMRPYYEQVIHDIKMYRDFLS